MSECMTCGSETKARFVCKACTGGLARDLRHLADLWPATEDVLTRQTKTGGGGGGGGKGHAKSTPLPYDETASEVRDVAANTITTWLRDLAGDEIPDGVRDTPTAARWIAEHHQDIGLLQQGAEMLDELQEACRQVVRLVDRREPKGYYGNCDDSECGQELWGRPDDIWLRCLCGKSYSMEDMRRQLAAMTDGTIGTPSEISALARQIHGIEITPDRIRWMATKDLITARGQLPTLSNRMVSAYQVGDVLDAAHRIDVAKREAEYRRAQRRKKTSVRSA